MNSIIIMNIEYSIIYREYSHPLFPIFRREKYKLKCNFKDICKKIVIYLWIIFSPLSPKISRKNQNIKNTILKIFVKKIFEDSIPTPTPPQSIQETNI